MFLKLFNLFIRRLFKIKRWHTSTYYERDYAKWVVSNTNEIIINDKSTVVEIGCGIGEINSKNSYEVSYRH